MTDETLDQTTQICRWLAGTGIELFELRGPGTLLRLKRNGASYAVQPETAPVSDAAVPASGTTQVVRAGSVGVLLHAHPLRQAPLVQVGDVVRAGQALAVLRIGAVLLAVAAPRDGTVASILAADGATVGYGEPLVELE
jgi:acetyl-CoA carboxylase biotin carboxyl carrier protein